MANKATLSREELWRIKQLVQPPTEHSEKKAKKAVLAQRSKDRYKNWNDTLEALRERKQKERQDRLAKIEAAQERVDEEEAKYQNEQRKRAIDRANRLLYQDTERVKRLHSSLLLSQVLLEREAQIKKRQQWKSQRAEIDEMYHNMELKEAKKVEDRERRERRQAKRQGRALAKEHRHQLREFEERRLQQLQAQQEEGVRIKQMAEEDEANAAAELVRQAQMKRKKNTEHREENQRLSALRAKQREEEAKEMARIQRYAEEKQQLEDERKEKAAEVQRARLKLRTDLIEEQQRHLAAIKQLEEERLASQLEVAEQKRQARIEEDQKRRSNMDEQIKASRKSQVDRKRREKEAIARQDRDMVEEWKRRSQEITDAEAEERRRKRKKNIRMRRAQRKQMRAKEVEVFDERQEALQQAERTKLMKIDDENQFQEYAKEAIKTFGIHPEAEDTPREIKCVVARAVNPHKSTKLSSLTN